MKPVHVVLRSERAPMLAWSLGLAAYMLMLGAVFSAFDPGELEALMENYPEDLLKVFGDITTIGTVDGFLEAELASLFPLVLGVFAVMLMTKHLAGAEEQGRLDHVLARPLTRRSYYWHLLLAGATIVAVMLAGGALGGILGFALADAGPRELAGIIGFMLDLLPLGLFYLGLGAVCGSLFHRRAPANLLGTVVVVVLYMLDVVARLVQDLDWLAYWTPNGYLSKSDLYNADPHLGYLAFALGLALLLAYLGSVVFDRKDLYA